MRHILYTTLTYLTILGISTTGHAETNTVKSPNFEVFSLINPVKLGSLKPGNRSANPRFRKLMFWIHDAETKGVSPKQYIAYLYFRIPNKNASITPRHVFAPRTELSNLVAQYRLGKRYSIYTPRNLELLRKGNSPIIGRGEHLGSKLHVDHILSAKDFPQLENSMANLAWLPAKLNLSKGAKFTNASLRRAKDIYKETKWMKLKSFIREQAL